MRSVPNPDTTTQAPDELTEASVAIARHQGLVFAAQMMARKKATRC